MSQLKVNQIKYFFSLHNRKNDSNECDSSENNHKFMNLSVQNDNSQGSFTLTFNC